MNLFDLLIPAGLIVVFLTLCFGIYTLFRGGDFARSWSNKAMRFRVLAQFVVILILIAAMLWSRNNG
ncbi:MAG: twin transmembrane helix small protein [Vitreimonas sp.]